MDSNIVIIMNKKSLLLVMATATLALTAHAQGKYTINGNLQNAEGKKIYLSRGEFGNVETDSTIITNGKFTFKGEIDGPFQSASLLIGNQMDYRNAKSWQVAIEPLTIYVSGDANKQDEVTIKGGKVQDELNRMNKEMEVFRAPLMKLNDAYYAQTTKEGKDSVSKLMEPYQKQYAQYTQKYMKTRTDSYFAPQYLVMDMGNMAYEDIKAIWEKFSPDVQKYGVSAKKVKSELETLAKVRPGCPAPDFTANDINGKPFTLSSLKGKVVIIDFWASWCGPCRKSNPHMRELYAKYHKKGLDMVYVSDDDSNPAKWKAAVEKDQLVGDGFHHVLRGLKITDKAKYTFDKTNDISDKYAIHFLPTKYLIDKKGNIVCKINEGEDAKLDAQIEKLLNE